MSPPALASRVCTLTFILAFLALVGRTGVALGLGLFRRSFIRGFLSGRRSFRFRRSAGFLLGGDGGDFFVARQRRNFVDRSLVDKAGDRDFGFLGLHLLDNAGGIRRGI